MEYLNKIICFMRANEDLAGWAQAFGAIVAIGIAIAIPAYQRYAQSLDSRRQRAELMQMHQHGVFFIMADTHNWLISRLRINNLPRSDSSDDCARDELLKRILMLENTAKDHKTIAPLFLARGAILQTNIAYAHKQRQGASLFKAELDLLNERITLLEGLKDEAEIRLDSAIHANNRIQLALLGRMAYPFMKKIIFYFKQKNL